MKKIDRLKLRYEVARKAIHLSSISIPVIYYFITREIALLLLVPLFAGFFLVDLLKNFYPPVAKWYHSTFDAMLRNHELEKKPYLNGATYITMGALLLVLFFLLKLLSLHLFRWFQFQIPLRQLSEKRLENTGLVRKAWREVLLFLFLQ